MSGSYMYLLVKPTRISNVANIIMILKFEKKKVQEFDNK